MCARATIQALIRNRHEDEGSWSLQRTRGPARAGPAGPTPLRQASWPPSIAPAPPPHPPPPTPAALRPVRAHPLARAGPEPLPPVRAPAPRRRPPLLRHPAKRGRCPLGRLLRRRPRGQDLLHPPPPPPPPRAPPFVVGDPAPPLGL